MEERKITEVESIEIITSMTSHAKERLVKDSGDIPLIWGCLVVAVSGFEKGVMPLWSMSRL